MELDAFADHISRNVSYPPEVRGEVVALARRLLALRDDVPPDSWLILGGSLARGEPAFVPGAGGYQLESDIDLMLVHRSMLPPVSVEEFVARNRPNLPTISLMTVSEAEYRRLETTLGYEFKDLGIAVNQPALPPHTPVRLDQRDAYEFLLFSIAMYFWDGTVDRWIQGDDSLDFHLPLNRICVKVLRAYALVAGGYNHHDVASLPAHLAEQMRAEIRWRKSPHGTPGHPGRFWPILGEVLRKFDEEFGFVRPDAVTGTRYEGRRGADVVAWHHRLAHAIARRILAQLGDGLPGAEELYRLKQSAWTEIVESGIVRPVFSPEVFFSERMEHFRGNLFLMKVSPTVDAERMDPWRLVHADRGSRSAK